MKCNVGKRDKMIRYIVGVGIIALGLWTRSWIVLMGLVLVGTAAINFCPMYKIFGIKTCDDKCDK